MINVTIVASSLGCGGTERVISYLANFWSREGWNVTVMTLEETQAPDHFPLEPGVQRVRLGLVRGGRSVASKIALFPLQMRKLALELRRTKPAVIVSFLDWVNVLTLSAGQLLPDIPTIISERIDPHANPISYPLKVLRKLTYPRAHALVLVCRSAMSYFPQRVQNRSQIIPNPASPGFDPKSAQCSNQKISRILGVGRLAPQKNFIALVSAFISIADQFPTWELVVYGEGSERSLLEQIIRDSGLSHRIKLPGWLESTAEAYGSAEIFVLPSLFEGFSNALIEAMAAGLPVIAYDCPGANSEIIQTGVNGILLPLNTDIEPLADALATLIRSTNLRERLGREASKVTKTFSEERFLSSWTRVVLDAVGSAHQ